MFKKNQQPPPATPMQIHVEVERHVLMQSQWRAVTDDELPAALAALSDLVGKKTAAQPSWARRLGVLRDGTGFVLALEIVADEIIGLPWHPSPSGPPQFIVAGFPLAVGVELLQGPLNPEAELMDRRRRYSEYLAAQSAKAAAQAKASADQQASQAREDEERGRFHADDWRLLNEVQRLAVRLALALEPRDVALAGDLRALVRDSLTGLDDDPESWPRTPAWCQGLGLEGLSAERRQALALEVVGERENRQLEQIPRDRLPSLKLMAGNDRAAVLAHWQQISRLNRRAAGGKAA
jgi:hypothetical protein